MNISQTLRSWRARHNFSQDYVSKKLGISTAQWSKIEREEKPLPVHFLADLGKLFGVSAPQLIAEMTETKFMQGVSKEEAAHSKYNPAQDGDECAFYKALAKHYEQKYLDLLKLFIEKQVTGPKAEDDK
jgi:transcriptional regulator with XRE-family HTH domain